MTSNPAYRDPYVSTLGEEHNRFARMNVARAPFGELDAVERLLEQYSDRVAMVCVEPIQGEGGVHPGTRDFLVGLRELTHRHGALLGIDEIQSGCGRTGDFAAWTTVVGKDPELGVDVAWFAKALGGGFPIAACVARGELAQHMVKGSHGSTFGGNPLACAASLATLEIMDDQRAMASAAAQLPTLRSIAERAPIPEVREIRGLGAMIGIELGDADLAGRVVAAMQDEGVLVTQSGSTAIRWLFAYHAAQPQLEEAWTALGRALEKVGSRGYLGT
jgi:acetylornithine/succinyldiaminopimelate/putrescine aminotransferase